MNYTRSDFPKDFLFGVAGSTEQNLDLTREAGIDCYQFQMRWDQILPEGRGEVNQAGLDAYDQLADALLKHGIRPCATLSDGELPMALTDLGGWRNRDIANWFADFAEIVMNRVGDRMFSVAPISLPSRINRLGHCENHRATARTIHHLLLAIGKGNEAMRSLGMSNLGVALNFNLFNPADDAPDGVAALDARESHQTRIFLGGLFQSAYPEKDIEDLHQHLPLGWQDDFETIGAPVDWCSLEFNSHDPIEASALTPCLTGISQEYTRDLPIYVTALGLSDPGTVQVDYLDRQLAAAKEALIQGVPVKGLFVRQGGALDTLKTALPDGSVSLPLAQPAGGMRKHWNLVADIGGTNTRLGVISDGKLTELRKYPTGSLPELLNAFHDLRDEIGTTPRAVVAAGAGPVHDGTIRLTNAQLDLSESDIGKATGAQHTFVINDFTAAAWSVAEVTGDDVEVLQGDANPPSGTRLVVGPGTGLGVGALLYADGRYHTASGEGGHVGLSPRHVDEVEIFRAARHIAPDCFFDDTLVLEAEMFLSGTGLPILYRAAAMAAGQAETPMRSAKEILEDARAQTDPISQKAAQMFTTHLGAVMGDLAVVLMPRGGVFLVGGVAEKNRWLFKDAFRDAFNAGGRFSNLRRSMNLYVSEQDEFGIVGANNFCKSALAR